MINFFPVRKWFILIICMLCTFSFFYFDLYTYLRFETIKAYQLKLLVWKNQHYFYALALYFFLFTALIACAIPCATIMTLLGGFFFGKWGILYSLVATTLGGAILFLIVKSTLGDKLDSFSNPWLKKMEAGIRDNAFNYLLMLRLVPIFPCWISNIGAGILNVPTLTFVLATFIGLAPSCVIYALAGQSLDKLLLADESAVMSIIFTPSVFFPLLGLALLSIFPVIYRYISNSRSR